MFNCWSSHLEQGDVKILDGNDPGQCDKSNHAQEVLVRDRQNNEKILICSKNHGGYQWKTVDGKLITILSMKLKQIFFISKQCINYNYAHDRHVYILVGYVNLALKLSSLLRFCSNWRIIQSWLRLFRYLKQGNSG